MSYTAQPPGPMQVTLEVTLKGSRSNDLLTMTPGGYDEIERKVAQLLAAEFEVEATVDIEVPF